MSDETPGVHYQISVTGRQAAAFFLVLLVALGLAFYFGMKTGAAATRGPGAATTIAQASDISVPATTSTGEAAPGKTGDVKLGFAPGARNGSAPPAAPARETPTPAVEPTAVPTPPPTPRSPAPTPVPKPAKKGGPFYAQVLATQKAELADSMTKKLRADGFPADVTPVPGKKGWFRVRVGPYTERSKAAAAAAKIQKAEKTKNRPLVVP